MRLPESIEERTPELATFHARVFCQKERTRGDQRHIREGERHNQLISFTTKLRKNGFDGDELRHAVLALNAQRCDPPLRETEVSKIIDWGSELGQSPLRQVIARRGDTVKTRKVEWAWPGHIPRGKITVIDGDPGLGKSVITTDLAARITTGREMPDGSPGIEGNVVIISYEDDPEDTIVPRFEAAGGDSKRLLLVNAVQGENGEEPLTVPTDILELENFVKQNDVALVVIDPLMAALASEVKSNVDHHIRRALAPLKTMAERAMLAVIIVRHLNKNTKISSPILRGGGSIGIIGAARAGLIVGVDPEDPNRRILAVSKMNLAPDDQYALAYHVISDPDRDVGVVEWLGQTDRTARDLLEQSPGGDRGALDDAVGKLHELLASGPVAAKEAQKYMTEADVSKSTLKRARKRLGVKATPRTDENGQRSWWWELPPERSRK